MVAVKTSLAEGFGVDLGLAVEFSVLKEAGVSGCVSSSSSELKDSIFFAFFFFFSGRGASSELGAGVLYFVH
jgi:hypothetical protein